MAGPTYTFDHVDAAMCIIEEIVAPTLATTPWEKYRDQVGITCLRAVVLDRLAWPCHEAWERANARMSAAIISAATREDAETQQQELDPGAFDYDFVPFWIRECVDWRDVVNGPRVKGSKPGLT